jgi:hypothetical protein
MAIQYIYNSLLGGSFIVQFILYPSLDICP